MRTNAQPPEASNELRRTGCAPTSGCWPPTPNSCSTPRPTTPGDRIGEVRAKVLESLAGVKARAGDLRDDTLDNARAAGRAADDYVHGNPWRIVAIGAIAGFGLGLLLGRGSSSDS